MAITGTIMNNQNEVSNDYIFNKAKYRQCLDPTVEDVKKLCLSMRRNAKEERVLFHYNGHGVPRPTNNGEVWVFNKVRIPCLKPK